MRRKPLCTVDEYTAFFKSERTEDVPRTAGGQLSPRRVRDGLQHLDAFVIADSKLERYIMQPPRQLVPDRVLGDGVVSEASTDETGFTMSERVFLHFSNRGMYCDGHLLVKLPYSIDLMSLVRDEAFRRTRNANDGMSKHAARRATQARWAQARPVSAWYSVGAILDTHASGEDGEHDPTENGGRVQYLGASTEWGGLAAIFGRKTVERGDVTIYKTWRCPWTYWAFARLALPSDVSIFSQTDKAAGNLTLWVDGEDAPFRNVGALAAKHKHVDLVTHNNEHRIDFVADWLDVEDATGIIPPPQPDKV